MRSMKSLGTSSALPNGGGTVPGNPAAADLFRYGAPGVRSFALNTSTAEPCTGTPTAYFSVNGGITNLSNYNNCNNGGDYGDWGGAANTRPGPERVRELLRFHLAVPVVTGSRVA